MQVVLAKLAEQGAELARNFPLSSNPFLTTNSALTFPDHPTTVFFHHKNDIQKNNLNNIHKKNTWASCVSWSILIFLQREGEVFVYEIRNFYFTYFQRYFLLLRVCEILTVGLNFCKC